MMTMMTTIMMMASLHGGASFELSLCGTGSRAWVAVAVCAVSVATEDKKMEHEKLKKLIAAKPPHRHDNNNNKTIKNIKKLPRPTA